MFSFKCPNCDSNKYLNKHSFGKKISSGPYKNVHTEIQCANCFIDIPIWANLGKLNQDTVINELISFLDNTNWLILL